MEWLSSNWGVVSAVIGAAVIFGQNMATTKMIVDKQKETNEHLETQNGTLRRHERSLGVVSGVLRTLPCQTGETWCSQRDDDESGEDREGTEE